MWYGTKERQRLRERLTQLEGELRHEKARRREAEKERDLWADVAENHRQTIGRLDDTLVALKQWVDKS